MVRVRDDGQGYGYRSGLWIMDRVRNNGRVMDNGQGYG